MKKDFAEFTQSSAPEKPNWKTLSESFLKQLDTLSSVDQVIKKLDAIAQQYRNINEAKDFCTAWKILRECVQPTKKENGFFSRKIKPAVLRSEFSLDEIQQLLELPKAAQSLREWINEHAPNSAKAGILYDVEKRFQYSPLKQALDEEHKRLETVGKRGVG